MIGSEGQMTACKGWSDDRGVNSASVRASCIKYCWFNYHIESHSSYFTRNHHRPPYITTMATTNGADGHTNGTNGHTNGVHLPALSTSAEDFLRHNYDYIIIGGGTAGLCVAARLTENADVTVGVLEAGGNKLGDMMVDCPAMFLQMFSKPEYDWNFKTVPQVSLCNCLQLGALVLMQSETQQQQGASHPQRKGPRR